MEREKLRRREAERRKTSAPVPPGRATVDDASLAPSVSARSAASGQLAAVSSVPTGSSASGRRQAGQRVPCGWCGRLFEVKARGRMPKWCSAACRHRAWEQERAARSGRAVIEVRDRYVAATPTGTFEWLDQLHALTDQVRHGHLDLALLGEAIEYLGAEIVSQVRPGSDAGYW